MRKGIAQDRHPRSLTPYIICKTTQVHQQFFFFFKYVFIYMYLIFTFISGDRLAAVGIIILYYSP